jgi:hypothetical protein
MTIDHCRLDIKSDDPSAHSSRPRLSAGPQVVPTMCLVIRIEDLRKSLTFVTYDVADSSFGSHKGGMSSASCVTRGATTINEKQAAPQKSYINGNPSVSPSIQRPSQCTSFS